MRAQDRKLLESTKFYEAVGGETMERLTRSAFVQLVPKDGLLFMQGDAPEFVSALRMGYAGVQMGTRFIATPECRASEPYKQAIVRADATDVVLSERISGIPVAVLNTPYVQRVGLRAGPLSRRLLRHPRTKHAMRGFYALRAAWQLKRASLDEKGAFDFWQAGRSVAGIHAIEPAGDIVRRFAAAAG